MISTGLATAEQAVFDLDFHAALGRGPALRAHPPTRLPLLTFFAQDSGTHNLVYANADISKATQNRKRSRSALEKRLRRPNRTCSSWTRRRPMLAEPSSVKFLTLGMRFTNAHGLHQRPGPQRLQDRHPQPRGKYTKPGCTNE